LQCRLWVNSISRVFPDCVDTLLVVLDQNLSNHAREALRE
jgi:hypothetical protein